MDTLVQDFRYGVRMLLKRPAITAFAVISLALGIGANTTIFTVIRAVFLNPIPVEDSASLVQIFMQDARGTAFQFAPLSYPNARDLREQNSVLSDMAIITGGGAAAFRVEGDDAAAENLPVTVVTGNYFSMLGVESAAGRLFDLPMSSDDNLGAHPEAVISHALWERRFAGDPGAIGRVIMLNNNPFTISGVAAPNFKGTQSVANSEQIWVHISMRAQVMPPNFVRFLDSRRAGMMIAIGRRAPGVTNEQAQAEFTNIARRLEEEFPEQNTGRTAALVPFSPVNPNQSGQFAFAGRVMMGVVGLVLLIACANVANLLLARAVERETEIAVRVALGAQRVRLMRQLLTESVLLALSGGLVGLLIAFWSRDILWSLRPPFLGANSVDLRLDPMILGFTLGVSLLTGVVFGLIPALQASNPDLKTTLQEGGRRGTSGTSKLWLRSALAVTEVALALVTLIGAGLFVRSMQNAQQIDPGFETERLFVLNLNTLQAGYDLEQAEQFFDRLLPRVEAVGGVKAAALSQNGLFGGGFLRSVFPEGVPLDPDQRVLTFTNPSSPGYFDTLGIPLLRGRTFTEADDESAPFVAIANEAMGERFWPGENPVGKRFLFFSSPDDRHHEQYVEIVGLVKDSLTNLGQPPQPIVYTPYKQWYSPGWVLTVQSQGDPDAVMGNVTALVREMEPNLPITGLTTAEQNISQQLWAPRMGAGLLALFGLLAMALASVGIYGVMSNSVDQRAHEMGIRMALGAGRSQVVSMVVKQGMRLVAAGVLLGLVLAFALARVLQNMLFDLSATDPLTFAAVAGGLMLVAFLATWLPARRLTSLDPAIALRAE